MKYSFPLIFILFTTVGHVQTDTSNIVVHTDKNTTIYAESYFPGGISAWNNYISNNLRYPDFAKLRGIRGYVVVSFIIDSTGIVSGVKAIKGPSELREPAVDVILKSPK